MGVRLRMVNVMWEKDNCPYCVRTKFAVILHNATHDPEDWIDIVDVDLGDSTLPILESIFKMSSEDVSEKGYLPTGMIKTHFVNFVRGTMHFYWFLKKAFERR